MIKAIAIDDEPIALDVIKTHAAYVPFLKLEASFIRASEALTYIKANTVDLVFLDINMPDFSGLDLAEVVRHQAQIIFTTAYPEHALKGFELAATDYLLKPINFKRFLQACKLAETRSDPEKADEIEKTLFVKDGYKWVRIKLSEVLYIQAQDNYVSICEKDKSTLTRMTLNELEQRLSAAEFVRVHKSYLVAIAKIEKIENHQITVNTINIPLSKSYRSILLDKCKKFATITFFLIAMYQFWFALHGFIDPTISFVIS